MPRPRHPSSRADERILAIIGLGLAVEPFGARADPAILLVHGAGDALPPTFEHTAKDLRAYSPSCWPSTRAAVLEAAKDEDEDSRDADDTRR